jgi:Tfp pilus assembly protein PilP
MGDAAKYEDKGRKDPFVEVSISSSTGGLSVVTTKLTGIVRSSRSTLALLETQEGIGYILKPGDTLGDGRLMEIGADNVVFAVMPKAGLAAQRVVLRLAAN